MPRVRILVISDLYPPVAFGGYEMECGSVVEHLRRAHDVHVLTCDRDAERAPADATVLRQLPYSSSGRAARVLAPLHAARAVRVARRVLAATRPELVYVWNATAVPSAAVRVAVDAGAPVALRLCERWYAERLLGADHFLRFLTPGDAGVRAGWGRLMRLVNRLPGLRLEAGRPFRAAVGWNSRALRDEVQLPAIVEPVLERIIYPATRAGAHFASLPRRPADVPRVLFVGRVWPQKGSLVAVRALAALERRHAVRARLQLVGPCTPADRAQVEAEARAHGVAERVEISGPLGIDQLGEAFERARVFVAPSMAEAFGLACVEAALARVPVVASRVGGIPEALREGEHALYFVPGDAEGCAGALAEALRDGTAGEQRVARAFERAQELSLDAYLAATDRFIAEATAALGAGAS